MKLGWLHDDIGIVGGAEMSERTLREGAPEWAEIVLCPPNKKPPDDIEAYIIQHCTTYDRRWIEALQDKPFVKQNRDSWWAGSVLFRRWLLDNADLLVFSSEMQVATYCHHVKPGSEIAVVPPPVDLEWFRAEARPPEERQGAVWVGRADPGKALHLCCDWAIRNDERLDVYGDVSIPYIDWSEFGGLITHHGRVPYEALPAIYGAAKKFVFMPIHREPFGRTVAEAWAAGCELVVEGDVGALEWIEERPEDVGRGVEMFWDEVAGALQ